MSISTFGSESRRAARPTHRKYQLNEAVFEEDTPSEQVAYFAGLLLADGCVHRHKCGSYVVSLRLHPEDRAIIERFRDFLESTHPIRERSNGLDVSGQLRRMCVFNANSVRLARSLERYGVVPGKTHTATAPSFLANNPHFWRGLVDGDGWVTLGPGRESPEVGFCGTRQVVYQFRDFVATIVPSQSSPRQSSNSKINWRFALRGWRAVAVARVLYAGCSIALPRKLRAAQTMLANPCWLPPHASPPPCPPLEQNKNKGRNRGRCRWHEGGKRLTRFFGPWGSDICRERYEQFAAEWEIKHSASSACELISQAPAVTSKIPV